MQRPLGLWQSQKEMKIEMQTRIRLSENFKEKDVPENKVHYTDATAIENKISGMNNGVKKRRRDYAAFWVQKLTFLEVEWKIMLIKLFEEISDSILT